MNKKSNEVVQNSKVSERGAADSRARLQALTTRWLPFCNKQIFFANCDLFSSVVCQVVQLGVGEPGVEPTNGRAWSSTWPRGGCLSSTGSDCVDTSLYQSCSFFYNGEIGKKIDLVVTFDLGVLLTQGQRD